MQAGSQAISNTSPQVKPSSMIGLYSSVSKIEEHRGAMAAQPEFAKHFDALRIGPGRPAHKRTIHLLAR